MNQPPSEILVIGRNSPLTYLIGRYAEQGGYQMRAPEAVPSMAEIGAEKPAAILFPAMENLEQAQGLVADLAGWEIPILVCSSLADEPRARELGADHCLLHPLTYDGFLAGLTAAQTRGKRRKK
jgi:CheY-like chemotaxis protein